MKSIFYIFFIVLITIPFYFFNSGKPQLSHLLLAIGFLIILLLDKKFYNIGKLFNGYRYLYWFILWTFVIGFFFFIIYKDYKLIMAPTYFLFNFLAMYYTIRLYYIDKWKLLKFINNSLILSVVILLAIDLFNLSGYFHSGEDRYREILTFNNPNQLGYWTLLVATILYIIKPYIKKSKLNTIKFYLSIMALTYLSLISLSKASSISILILVLLNGLKNLKMTVLLIIASFLTASMLLNSKENNFMKKFDKRINDVGDANDDNLEGRGYLRIIEYPEYLFFGAGEGATKERFNTEIELHSTFGTILFSYGFVGLFLFLTFLYKIFKISKFSFLKLLLPVLLYGIAHMGLRFTLFWVSLILFILVSTDLKKDELIIKLKKIK